MNVTATNGRITLMQAARAAAPAEPAPTAPAPAAPSCPSTPPRRGDRIAHFLRNAGESSLQHVRFASSVFGGELVGMAAGAVLFTPLAMSTGNLMVMTAGSAVTGLVGALTGYFIENSRRGVALETPAKAGGPVPSGTTASGGSQAAPAAAGSPLPGAAAKLSSTDALLAAGTALRAMPNVLYPTILGATAAEKQMILEALDALPLKDATSVATINVVDGLQAQGVAGVAHSVFSHSRILLDRAEMAIPGWNKEVVTHEVGHTVDMREGFGPIASASTRGGFGKGPFVSDYATTNRMEDFAESYVRYRTDAVGLRNFAPGKHAVLEEISQPGIGERLADQPAVREAGKNLGQAIGSVPYLRTALEVAGGLLGPIQMHRGSEQLEKGFAEGDAVKKFQGKMNLAQGVLLTIPGMAPLALGAAAANLVLSGQVQHGMKPETANAVANKVLAASLGPVGMMGAAVAGELVRAGVDLDKACYQPGEYGKERAGDTYLRGLLWTVGGMGAGSVVGAALGTALGGLPGALVGSQFGRLGGAAAGLAGYGVFRSLKADKADGPADALDLTSGDKWFLGKVVGGAVVGGSAGAVAGSMAGRLAGAAVGSLVAGPTGAVVGAAVGRFGGMLAGSLVLAKGGAAVGRMLDKGEE